MKYNISTSTSPKMPTLGKGTECIKLLLSQVSEDMREPLVPMLFPILGAHICGSEFQYPDLTWKETCMDILEAYPPNTDIADVILADTSRISGRYAS